MLAPPSSAQPLLQSPEPPVGAVLAAGLGTRLRPLTDTCPKPLVPVCGVPLLEYAIDALAALGIADIGINLFHLAERIPSALAHRTERLTFVTETELWGTGGGLRGIAARLPARTLLACNGDALFDFDLGPALAHHRASGAMATLVLRRPRPEEPFGRVAVDATGQIQRIAEVRGLEPDRDDLVFGVFTGIQLLEPAMIAAIPPEGACDILRSAYARRLAEGARVTAYFVPDDAPWLDVGTPERLLAAQRAVLGGARRTSARLPPERAPGVFVAADARIATDARLIAPCAVLAGAVIEPGAHLGPEVVVEPGARVRTGVRLERALVCAGACAASDAADALILAGGDVVPAAGG